MFTHRYFSLVTVLCFVPNYKNAASAGEFLYLPFEIFVIFIHGTVFSLTPFEFSLLISLLCQMLLNLICQVLFLCECNLILGE